MQTRVTLNVQLDIQSDSYDDYESQLDELVASLEERGWTAELEYEEVIEGHMLVGEDDEY